jgi:hypothetical protein
MDVTLIVSLIGLLTTLVGGGRWLLEVWFRKSENLEHLKHENHQLKITSLRAEADHIRKEFDQFKKDFNGELEKLRIEMAAFRDDLKRVVGKYTENQQSSKKVLEELQGYIHKNEKRFERVETQVDNFGKVIIREEV